MLLVWSSACQVAMAGHPKLCFALLFNSSLDFAELRELRVPYRYTICMKRLKLTPQLQGNKIYAGRKASLVCMRMN